MKNREEKIMAWGEAKLLHHLRNFKRSKWAFKDYAYAFRMLRKFFKMHRTYDYDPVLMETYRKIVRKRYEEGGLCINYYRLFTRLSVYMDNVYHGRQINDLNPPASTQTNCGTYVWPEEPYTMRLGRFFNSILNRYRKHLERQMSAKKAGNTEAKAHVFLSFLKANSLDVPIIDEKIIASFLTSALENGECYSSVKTGAELFTAFLSDNGFIKRKLNPSFFHLKEVKNHKVGHAFSDSDVKKMIDAIDRNTAEGKLEYAFITLLASTGIRGCDIVSIKLTDFDFNKRTFSFKQKKTETTVELPLTEKAISALEDYIHNGRIKTSDSELFINSDTKKPYKDPRKLLYFILDKAGIDKKGGDGIGVHSFRRALGGKLLDAGVEPAMMTELLGHNDPKAFTYYIPMAKEKLRGCPLALDGINCTSEVFYDELHI